MELEFPPLSGGTVSGLNDSGIETFEGDFARNVVRECGQNSLDAAVTPDQAVTVRIGRFSLQKTELSFMPALEKILGACRDHWRQHDKATKFFTAALALAARPQIDALKIRTWVPQVSMVQMKTTPAAGSDWSKPAEFRIRKARKPGGAFGIGKDARRKGTSNSSRKTCPEKLMKLGRNK